jgi:hypothetical protein
VLLSLDEDPNGSYAQEELFLFRDPPLESLQPRSEKAGTGPCPLPLSGQNVTIPLGLAARWHLCSKTMVLLGDFREVANVPRSDKLFLLEMMQRDDVAVVSEALLDFADPMEWTLESVVASFQNVPYHKLRCFD